ncbi:MAG: hypothetical protein IAE90_10295 [Ignavibacteria bacterium]|nr:hypothetical protein [Ignavibacteria bacterium]
MKKLTKYLFFLILLAVSAFSQERNEINLFGKEMMFGTSISEFEIAFPDFRLMHRMENISCIAFVQIMTMLLIITG